MFESFVEAVIEERANQALAEIRKMADAAREEIDRRAAFLKRSHGQRKRWWRAKNLRGENA